MERRGIDFIEVGIPFSDPMADGPVIQDAATKALRNGMSLRTLFDQLYDIRREVSLPLILMGYMNPIYRYGYEAFFERCAQTGIDGVIIPDLPFRDYLDEVKPVADRHDVRVIMLITPETSEERIHFIDDHTDGFIYMVSSAAITGAQKEFNEAKQAYFNRVNQMQLKHPRMIGFGISNRQTLQAAQSNAAGAIIGSKFVQLLDETHDPEKALDLLMDALKH
jgi:tryptophan synthase alpha chain